jgi:glycerol-3-phosphate dehydrogenase
MLDRARDHPGPWDMVIVGGGATGVGIAVDAAARGYEVLLLEQSDFGKATSSRSTKLIHGGVRYLRQGNIALVMEALQERGILRRNAPHLVHDLAFVVPNYDWWEAPFYGIGLKVYDLLAGKYGFGASSHLSKAKTLELIPTLETDGLRGGIRYYDGQFDDARLLINLAQTAAEQGAALVNYCRVDGLTKDTDGWINGVRATDMESGEELTASAKCVINATGAFADTICKLDDAGAEPMIAPSQGVHIVLDAKFLPGNTAIMVPRTSDGRVLFAIPWHGHTLVGTTDTPVEEVTLEPRPTGEELEFLLETADEYLDPTPTRDDVLSVWAGIRPLARAGGASSTAALSREHVIHISPSGLLTIAGGKWTTYRKMAEDCVDHAATLANLEQQPCVTRDLPIHGHQAPPLPSLTRGGQGESGTAQEGVGKHLDLYGSDAPAIDELMRSDPTYVDRLHDALPISAAQIVWAARHEMARTLDDVLARRTRALQLNARAALAMAPRAAALMAAELARDAHWAQEQVEQFQQLAQQYLIDSYA